MRYIIQTNIKTKHRAIISNWLKLFFVLLPLILILAACGGEASSNTDDDSSNPQTDNRTGSNPDKGSGDPPAPPSDACQTDPTAAGCEEVLAKICETTPTAAGCDVWFAKKCEANPQTEDCLTALIEKCLTDVKAAGCENVITEVCATTPNAKGCEAALIVIQCIATPSIGCLDQLDELCEGLTDDPACLASKKLLRCSTITTSTTDCEGVRKQVCAAASTDADCLAILNAIKCSVSPTSAGCETVLLQICVDSPSSQSAQNAAGCPTLNNLLGLPTDSQSGQAVSQTSVSNFVIRSYFIIPEVNTEDTQPRPSNPTIYRESKPGVDITSFKYGTLELPTTGFYESSHFLNDKFTIANTPALLVDNNKNNIIQIDTGVGDDSLPVLTNYYYSHINGKPFKQFLPSLNNLEVLILHDANNSLPVVHSSGGLDYTIFKTQLEAAKNTNYNYQGVTLARFASSQIVPYVNIVVNKYGEKLYPGTFNLTINNITSDKIGKEDNHFSMLITFDKPVDEIKMYSTPDQEPPARPAMQYLKLENYIFGLDNTNNINSYIEGGENNSLAWSSYRSNQAWNTIFFNSDYSQVGGTLSFWYQQPRVRNAYSYIDLTFVSNDYCIASEVGCPSIE